MHHRSVHDREILRLALPPLGGLAVAGAVLVAVFNIFNLLAYSTTAGGR